MKTTNISDHVYINEALKCSTLSITENSNTNLQGSNEFILTEDGRKIIPPTGQKEKLKLWLKERSRKVFTKKMLHRRIPILNWLPKYSKEDGIGDIVAGLTVGLTIIPQALAYASIAGLPAAYGLYGSFLGCFVYIFLGSCKDVPVGPSAIVALLTMGTAGGSWQKSVILCFLCGVIELLMGILGLGFIIDFVSGPVSSGFTSAVSLIILSSQVKGILGIDAKGSTFLEIWRNVIKELHNTRAADTLLGLICLFVLLILKVLSTFEIGPDEKKLRTRRQNIVNKFFWTIGTARNAILVIVCGAIGYVFHSSIYGAPFKLIGHVPPGMPSFQFPKFSISSNESFTGKEETFSEIITQMGSGLIVVPMISLMENIAICKAFANGKAVDATQELIALGVANIANSFVSGFPGTGAISRGAVNNASGVRTPMGNIYTGTIVILALIFFTPYFYFIPTSTLAAIIIAAVVFMIEIRVLKPMWRTKKSDLIPGIGTFIACLLLPLEIGILFGIFSNLIFILYHAARPKITIEILTSKIGYSYLMITPDRCLMFPSADYVRHLLTKHSMRQENLPVVIDCSHVYGADYTSANAIKLIAQDFTQRNQILIFYNLKPSVYAIFDGLLPNDFVVYYNEEQLDELLQKRNLAVTVSQNVV